MKQKIVLATANQHKLQEINAIAQKFEIEFDNDRAEGIKLVGDVLDYIKELVAAKEEE